MYTYISMGNFCGGWWLHSNLIALIPGLENDNSGGRSEVSFLNLQLFLSVIFCICKEISLKLIFFCST